LLEEIKLFFTLFKLIGTIGAIDKWIKRRDNTFELREVENVCTEFFSNRIPLGAYVTGQAFFSEFAHTFIPPCYSTYRPGAASSTINHSRFIAPNKIEYNANLMISPTIFPLPVQSLPRVSTGNGNYKIGFLYPKEFSGFIYPVDPEKNKKVVAESEGIALSIPRNAKPIPVIYEERFSSCLGSIVDFEAQVTEIPSEFISPLFNGLGIYAEDIFANAYKPLNPHRVTLCLKVTGEHTEIKSNNKIIIPIKGALFVETHLEGFASNPMLEQILDSAIPELNPGITSTAYTGYEENKYYITQGAVRVTFRKPNILNYYIETELNNTQKFINDVDVLRRYIRNADKNIQKSFQAEGQRRYKMKLDFLFDYQRASIFDSRGILESSEADNVIKSNPDFQAVKNWLRGKG